MRKMMFLFALLGVMALVVAPPAEAKEKKKKRPKYQEISVDSGGSVTGKVMFSGTVPEPTKFELLKFPNVGFCSKISDGKGSRVVQLVNVKRGALQDVVVYIPSIMKGKEFKFGGTDVKANTCRFLALGGPSTLSGVVKKKGEFRVINEDSDPDDPKAATGVLHNPHAYEVTGTKSSTIFNVPLPNKGQTINKKMKLRKINKGSYVKLECDQHNFMQAYFLPVENPYYSIVGEDGSFSIDGIPPGEYEVQAWHPKLGRVSQNVKVASNGSATADFTFKK